ncbi:hypothetical protein F9C07_11079 [Aspergillus flavus]|uniref:Uncharacterized protein n=4 Tax=Aspergillus subgen. Circumdati TaxID=2720871 RepID=A0A7U2MSE5_ASPFN|nr:unnamed protein product [Aspergillus oryzae RIB40]EIT72556.1 hypothetical protein Ao3042_01042 [Aspergillus oryzae 3.042]KAB8242606.1 hypothetical protein BDV35DRAFT_383925 [Aspergillus flavus]KDE77384.1 hypothetical protein AO1008_03485 [Aspergillus oryzae 100-8]KOC11189.1 hypothetical protein AFLA70_187g002070 [Aspergillus flavus AF70]QRD88983.1 hypothetical protein F9C07_11079 [Aspergillus flavus]|eukprot:EIT72556.1 hypothetical protein Ao3042_01042 [Aspergillus oryzae 3.042]
MEATRLQPFLFTSSLWGNNAWTTPVSDKHTHTNQQDRNFRSREVPLERESSLESSKLHLMFIYPKRVIVQIQAVVGRALPVREPSSPPIKRSMASRRKLSQGLGLLDMYT